MDHPSNGFAVTLSCKVNPSGSKQQGYTIKLRNDGYSVDEREYVLSVIRKDILEPRDGGEENNIQITEEQFMKVLSSMGITMRNPKVFELDKEDPNPSAVFDNAIKNGLRMLKKNGSFAFEPFEDEEVVNAIGRTGFDAIVSDLKSRGISESMIKDNVVDGDYDSIRAFIQRFMGDGALEYVNFVKKNADTSNAPAEEQPAEPAPEQPKQTVSGLKPMNLYDPEADENAEAGITSEVAPEEVVSADNGEWLKDQQVLQSIINGTHPNLLDDSVADFFEQMFPKYGEDEEKSAVVNAAMNAWTQAMLSSVNGLK